MLAHVRPAHAQRDGREATLAPAPLRPRWLLSVNGASAYESNVLFGLGRPEGDAYHSLSAALTGGLASARARVDLDIRGDVVRFARLGALDRETYDVGATLFRRWTSRIATQLATRAVTSTAPIGLPQLGGTTLLPLAVARTQAAVGSLTARVAARAELTAALDGSRVRFDQITFAGGSTVGGLVALAVKPSVRSTYGVVASMRTAAFNQTDVATETVESDLSRDLGKLSLRLRVGGTAVQLLSGERTVALSPTGSLELLRTRSSVAYSLRVGRSITPAFGFGSALASDQLAISAQRGLPKGNLLRLSGDVSRNTDPTEPSVSLRFLSVNGEWRRPLAGGLTLAIVGFARRVSGSTKIDNTGASLNVSYGGGR